MLTDSEDRFRSSYALLSPGQACQLNQNPDAGFGSASTSCCLPTLIANVHMLWTDRVSPARWMMGSEALTAQGFPLLPVIWGTHLKDLPCLSSFHVHRQDRSSRNMLTQAGNSMSCLVMTVLHLHGLCAWKPRDVPQLLANIRLSRTAIISRKRVRNFDDQPPDNEDVRLRAPKRRLLGKQAQPRW